jgi:hypothetical protein
LHTEHAPFGAIARRSAAHRGPTWLTLGMIGGTMTGVTAGFFSSSIVIIS